MSDNTNNVFVEEFFNNLFCGIGNFSLPLARRSGSVLGVEGEASLVERAAANASRNGIENAEFRVADLGKIDGSVHARDHYGVKRAPFSIGGDLSGRPKPGSFYLLTHVNVTDPGRTWIAPFSPKMRASMPG